MDEKRVVMVTGVSSGIGASTARMLVEKGFRVFGTVRAETTAVPDGVERIVLDVRDDESIDRGIEKVLARAGKIDALVNNAGASILGAIEETDLEQARALFDVNFFGAVRVTRRVLPLLRAQGRGRIVFISSVVGFLPAPFMGFYAASKHALEGYCESLDHEVRGFGVRAVLVEPGFTKTRIDANAARAARPIAAYDAARSRVSAAIGANVERGEEPSVVAQAVVAALTDSSPKLRYTAGKGTAMLATLRRWMPSNVFDRSLRREFRVDAEKS
jgi:NAD(P)-dependent dehydrogenase (short-subunit alcohol dehydrogenase family)